MDVKELLGSAVNAELLPAVVDYLTPEGKVPTRKQAAKRLETLAKAKT